MVAYGALPLNVFSVSSFITNKETRIPNMATSVVISTYNSKRYIIGDIKNKGFKDIHCIVHAISKDSSFVDDQISSTSDENQLDELVKKIKMKIMASKRYGDIDELIIIDAIQRIGAEYYFRDEIGAALEKHYDLYYSTIGEGTDNLHDLALCFRLLRQQGYYVSSDALEKFKDKNGNFNQELAKDIKGLMSLFEASQFSTRSEYVLDDANKFSRKLLKASLKNVEQHEGMVIGNTLRYPYHKSLPRVMAKKFLPYFKSSLMFLHDSNHINDWINEVYNLARIDINLAQISQQLEISQVSRWVNELSLDEELHFARIEPFKCCKWSMGILPGLDMSEERLELAKAVSFIYMIDDIFDSYGTYDELYLFTNAVTRTNGLLLGSPPRPRHLPAGRQATGQQTPRPACGMAPATAGRLRHGLSRAAACVGQYFRHSWQLVH
uniref:Uncharacterized protein n=1 Tax=Chenopodium quinoa TaxID=63459 RepID=A0A803LKY6_CHEQI